MTWNMMGKRILTADVTTPPGVSQSFIVSTTNGNHILKALTCGVILFNDPAFTSLSMELWSDRAGSPIKKISTSINSFSKAVLLTTDIHAARFLGFEFDNISLHSGSTYHAVLHPSAYTGTTSTFIAWRSTWPDPQYKTGLTIDCSHTDKFPLELGVISRKIA